MDSPPSPKALRRRRRRWRQRLAKRERLLNQRLSGSSSTSSSNSESGFVVNNTSKNVSSKNKHFSEIQEIQKKQQTQKQQQIQKKQQTQKQQQIQKKKIQNKCNNGNKNSKRQNKTDCKMKNKKIKLQKKLQNSSAKSNKNIPIQSNNSDSSTSSSDNLIVPNTPTCTDSLSATMESPEIILETPPTPERRVQPYRSARDMTVAKMIQIDSVMKSNSNNNNKEKNRKTDYISKESYGLTDEHHSQCFAASESDADIIIDSYEDGLDEEESEHDMVSESEDESETEGPYSSTAASQSSSSDLNDFDLQSLPKTTATSVSKKTTNNKTQSNKKKRSSPESIFNIERQLMSHNMEKNMAPFLLTWHRWMTDPASPGRHRKINISIARQYRSNVIQIFSEIGLQDSTMGSILHTLSSSSVCAWVSNTVLKRTASRQSNLLWTIINFLQFISNVKTESIPCSDTQQQQVSKYNTN